MPDHEMFMKRAVEAAQQNIAYPFGAVLVETDTRLVVAEGYNRTIENPCWHGEIDVMSRHAAAAMEPTWSSLCLYTTAEPCPMCQSAILWAGIPTVVYGTSIPSLKKMGWNQIDIRAEEVVQRTPFGNCQIIGGILEAECDELFARVRLNIKKG
jgi:tRNA(Arg) A34 adenosine deaminase TadA